VRTARQRCWRYDWVLDLDIKGFFDSIPHDLLLKALRKHTECRWVLLYVDRWRGTMAASSLGMRERRRDRSSVRSSQICSCIAFDPWMSRTHAAVPFERYADDVICHCRTRQEAEVLRAALEERFAACGLVLHPQKTKTV
jgi:RNA-directed DNA polymerase